MKYRVWLVVGAVVCAMSVAMGAFAAHALKATLDTYQLSIVQTGARYQMYHGFAILISCILGLTIQPTKSDTNHRFPIQLINSFFLSGVVLFSGSLYFLALFGVKWVVYMTPIGGFSFLLGWCFLAYAAYKFTLSRK